jgi:hypothetical protein
MSVVMTDALESVNMQAARLLAAAGGLVWLVILPAELLRF